MTEKNVLIVDDDSQIRELVGDTLTASGYAIKTASSISQAEGLLRRQRMHLLILDRLLPDGDSLEFVRKLRREPGMDSLPILILSASNAASQRSAGLYAGADDYMGKPFSTTELLARVHALLRRLSVEKISSHILRAGEISMNLDAHKVEVAGREITLAPCEFELLAYFLRRKGYILSRRQLLENCWKAVDAGSVGINVVAVAVRRLRLALGPVGERIVTMHSYGYCLQLVR